MFQFDARTVQPSVSLDPVPEGWYKVIIRKSNMKPVREKPNESYLELIMEIIEGQYATRVLYWNLNIFNSSQQAVEIAYKQLSAICHVVGQYQIAGQNAPDNVVPMLHNIPFFAHAVIAQGNRGPINNIRGVKDVYGNEPGKTSGATPATPAGAWGQPPQPAAPMPSGWQGGNSGGTAPGGFTPPPNPGAPAQWAPPPAATAPNQWQPPAQAAPPPQQQQQPQYQPPQQQPQQAPPQQQGGWTTGAQQQPQQPQQPPQQFQPPQQPPQQYQQPAPASQQQPPYQPSGGPAGAAPWQR